MFWLCGLLWQHAQGYLSIKAQSQDLKVIEPAQINVAD